MDLEKLKRIEANVFLKLGKVSKNFVCSGTAANEANGEAIQNTSPGKVLGGTRKYDATQTTRSSNKSSLSGMVTSYLLRPPLLTELKEDNEDDDATQQTASTNRSALTKLGLINLVLTDGDSTVCGSSDHETVETVRTEETRNSLLADVVEWYNGSDESTVHTNQTSVNSLCEEKGSIHDNTETKVKSPPDEPFLAPMKIERATSTRTVPFKESLTPGKIDRATSTSSLLVFPSTKQISSAASVAARPFTADDTNSVRSIKSAKSVGTKSVGTKNVDDQTVGEKSPESFVESVDDNGGKDDKEDATTTTHLSRKTTLVNHNAADGIEVYIQDERA